MVTMHAIAVAYIRANHRVRDYRHPPSGPTYRRSESVSLPRPIAVSLSGKK